MNWNAFKGAAKRIDDVDLPRIGSKIGVGEDELHAFAEVEAAGSGFDSQGRPKMLFEPHVFYRNLTGAKRTKAVAEGLAYAKWGTKPYPKDSYPRLVAAMAIDETAALKSASWGLGQILGENHKMIGYATPQAMVLAFMDDEEKHLEAMVDFLIAAGIDDDLKRHDWAAVARAYNGPGYAKHNYHGRMAAAYAKWRRIKDTPWTPGDKPPPPPVSTDPILRKGDGISRNVTVAYATAVKTAQRLLAERGFSAGLPPDGQFGSGTEAMVKAFQRQRGLTPDGVIGPATWAALRSATPVPMYPTPVPPPPDIPSPVPHPLEPELPDEAGRAEKITPVEWVISIGVIAVLLIGAVLGFKFLT